MFHAGFNMVGCSPDPDTVVEFETANEARRYLGDLITALWDERYEQCENGSDRLAVDGEMLDAHTTIHNAPSVPLTIIITEEWNRIAPLQWAYWITEDQPGTVCNDCGEALPEHSDEFDIGCSCPRCDHCNRTEASTPELEWDPDTGCHVECDHRAALAKQATPTRCAHTVNAIATCGNCSASWCDTCDPTQVAALCHYCHGRGYSYAEVAPPLPVTS